MLLIAKEIFFQDMAFYTWAIPILIVILFIRAFMIKILSLHDVLD